MEIENAQIESTHLGFEDHGIFSVNVNFAGDGWGQGTGHYALTDPVWIKNLLTVLGLEKWEDMPRQLVRIRRASGLSAPINGIGHITKNRWFNPHNGEMEGVK